jgi:hypothetical protein
MANAGGAWDNAKKIVETDPVYKNSGPRQGLRPARRDRRRRHRRRSLQGHQLGRDEPGHQVHHALRPARRRAGDEHEGQPTGDAHPLTIGPHRIAFFLVSAFFVWRSFYGMQIVPSVQSVACLLHRVPVSCCSEQGADEMRRATCKEQEPPVPGSPQAARLHPGLAPRAVERRRSAAQKPKHPACTIPLCRCAAVPLCRCAAVPLCRCAAVPLCRCAAVPLCRCAAVPLCCAAVPLCRCAAVPLCRCAAVPLCRCAAVPLCRCAAVPLCRCAAFSDLPLAYPSQPPKPTITSPRARLESCRGATTFHGSRQGGLPVIPPPDRVRHTPERSIPADLGR